MAPLLRGFVIALAMLQVAASQDPPPVAPPSPPAQAPAPDAPVEDLGNGLFRIGRIRIDSNKKTMTLPASVHMVSGPVEYVLVTNTGKTHEAVLVTDAKPSHVHLAALLLGIKPRSDLGPDQAAAKLGPTGVVQAWIEWDRNGPPARLSLTDTVALLDPTTGKSTGPLPAGLWLYNGSRMTLGQFVADQSGSLVSIIRDPDALINYPGASRDNDEIHVPHAARLPKIKTPVRVVLKAR